MDIDESIRCRGVREFCDIRFHALGHRPNFFPRPVDVRLLALFELKAHWRYLWKSVRPDNVEIILRYFRIRRLGALLIQKDMPEHDVSTVLHRRRKPRILIAGCFQFVDLGQHRRRRNRSDVSSQFIQRFRGGITFGHRKGGVKGDDPRSARVQFIHQFGVGFSGKGKRTDLL